MTNVLVFGMTENPGGVEAFLMNYFRNMDPQKIHLDFLCNSYEKIAYEDEILSAGSRTYHITARSSDPMKYKRELRELFKTHAEEYDVIWVNVSSLANIDYLIEAKRYGIPKRIIHSHNSKNMDSKLRGKVHQLNRRIIDRYATDFWACSDAAAEWFYRKDLLDRVVLIKNAIDVSKLRFDPEKRFEIRKNYGLDDKFVVGNVGRLHHQKNQSLAIRTYAELVKERPDAELVLIGQGEDEEKLKEEVRSLGLEKSVLFAGVQKNVPEWLSAMDLFLFPSVFEGQPIAALEAEANGLPVLASVEGSPQAKINDNFIHRSISDSPEVWADAVLTMDLGRTDPDRVCENFENAGYEIKHEAKRLETLLSE